MTHTTPSSVGHRALTIHYPAQGVDLPVGVLYPTDGVAAPHRIGPYDLDVAVDAPVVGHALPLVIISHGNNGSPWTHRGTAMHLARAGFVVVMPEHIGNSQRDASLDGTIARLVHRPRQLRRAIDAALTHPELGARIAREHIAVIGHSVGAYTALAVAGGEPTTMPSDAPAAPPQTIPVTIDRRVRALVLLAPAAGWYVSQNALANVAVPVLLYTGDADTVTPAFHAEIVLRGLRNAQHVRHILVQGAGHHSFQSPFRAPMVSPAFAPSQDPSGFDRAAFHERMNREITEWLLAVV